MILRRHFVPKALRRRSKSQFIDHVSQPYSKTGSTRDLKMRSFVLQHRYRQRHILVLSESITVGKASLSNDLLVKPISSMHYATKVCETLLDFAVHSYLLLPPSHVELNQAEFGGMILGRSKLATQASLSAVVRSYLFLPSLKVS